MHQFLKHLLLLALLKASIVSAVSVRLNGPNNEMELSAHFPKRLPRLEAKESNEFPHFYGPTTELDTLWSIASKIRPESNLTIQQTVFAIYKLNPDIFEDQNIHRLRTGSKIRIPSFDQIRNTSSEESTAIIVAHKAKLESQAELLKALSESDDVSSSKDAVYVQSEQSSTNLKDEDKLKITEEETPSIVLQIRGEFIVLAEQYSQLKLALASLRSEVDALRNKLSDNEGRIRDEIEKVLQEKHNDFAKAQEFRFLSFDQLFSNMWFVTALAIIPGLFIGLIIILLTRYYYKQGTFSTQQSFEQSKEADGLILSTGGEFRDSSRSDMLSEADIADLLTTGKTSSHQEVSSLEFETKVLKRGVEKLELEPEISEPEPEISE
ncbi:FimV/HubP family polar landmark protein, partial [Candidatus Photodesmus blepharus]|uniref:FimV/HubP family polar landmark protein n=1 Tax=Candidatus Photodesmus blepharonis TaxID=1179155 RepID=UPI00054CE1D1